MVLIKTSELSSSDRLEISKYITYEGDLGYDDILVKSLEDDFVPRLTSTLLYDPHFHLGVRQTETRE